MKLLLNHQGYFLEIQRIRQGLAADCLHTISDQLCFQLPWHYQSFPSSLRADGLLDALNGRDAVVLLDLREGSPTWSRRNHLYRRAAALAGFGRQASRPPASAQLKGAVGGLLR